MKNFWCKNKSFWQRFTCKHYFFRVQNWLWKVEFRQFEVWQLISLINKPHNLPDPSVESDVGEPEGPDPDEAEEGLVLVE